MEKITKHTSTQAIKPLSIVEHYAGLHGGTVHYDSRLNDGTTVTVTLPLQQTRH